MQAGMGVGAPRAAGWGVMTRATGADAPGEMVAWSGTDQETYTERRTGATGRSHAVAFAEHDHHQETRTVLKHDYLVRVVVELGGHGWWAGSLCRSSSHTSGAASQGRAYILVAAEVLRRGEERLAERGTKTAVTVFTV